MGKKIEICLYFSLSSISGVKLLVDELFIFIDCYFFRKMLFDIANLTYWIFLGIGVLLFLFVIISGGGEDQDLDTDVNFDSDIDVDTDVDFDADVDGDVDGDIDHNLKTDLDEGVEATIFSFLSWFGLGKCPLMILLAIDFSTWG